MKTKKLERQIKTIIKTGTGYGKEFFPVLRNTKKILSKINQGKKTSENYFQLGCLLLDLEDSQLGLDAFRTGYNLNKSHVYCGTYYALLLEQFGRTEEALDIYLQLNESNPENVEIAERMLVIYESKTDLKSVLILCQYFLRRGLNYHVIHRYLAKAYNQLSDNGSAVKHIEASFSLMEKDESNKYINLLVTYYHVNKDYKKILAVKDNIFSNKKSTLATKLLYVTSLAEVGKLSEARNLLCSLYIEHKKQNNENSVLIEIALFHVNYESDRKKSEFINRYILKREPTNIHAVTNLALHESDVFALNAYKKLYEQDKEHTHFKYNYGHSLINVQGDFEKGYELFESRIALSKKFLENTLSYPKTLDNKKIFIWEEQGIGDQIFLSWFFQFLANLNVKAKIQIDKRLLPLMNRSFPSLEFTGKTHKEVIITENLQSNYDHEIILYSLGKYFITEIKESQKEYETNEQRPAYLVPDDRRVLYWKDKLSSLTTKKTVGICWRSGLIEKMRYLYCTSVEQIIDIFTDLDCCVINVQYDYTKDELDLLTSTLGDRFIHFPEIDLKNDQDDLAALLKALDLVFTAGTAVYSLSGAVGVDTLCFFYFGKNDYYSIFGKPYNFAYPTVKIIGQKNTPCIDMTEYFKNNIIDALN